MCLVKALLTQGKGAPALQVMDAFPGGNEVVAVERLRPLARTHAARRRKLARKR